MEVDIYIKISDDTNDVIVDNSYDTNIENQYGYAYWTPHGGFWQDIYFSTLYTGTITDTNGILIPLNEHI